MQILIDTNIALDILLNRKPFVQFAVKIFKTPDEKLQKFISASAITDIYYIAYQVLRDKTKVKNLIKQLVKIIHVADVGEQEIISALDGDWSDFEDSVQNAVAEFNGFDAVVTRNPKDFKKSNLKVLTSEEFVNNFLN